MNLKRAITTGTLSGLIMGFSLFIGGAIASRTIYGPQFAPPGKFKPEQINAFYFLWTKLAIGWLFVLLFNLIYESLPVREKSFGILKGLKYGFVFWLVISLWTLSHPLIYETIKVKDQVFWEIYQLIGFLGLGASMGFFYKKYNLKSQNLIQG